jgi:hypothetical protein
VPIRMAIHADQEERAKMHRLGSLANLYSAVTFAQLDVVPIRRVCRASVSAIRDSIAQSRTLAVWPFGRPFELPTNSSLFHTSAVKASSR